MCKHCCWIMMLILWVRVSALAQGHSPRRLRRQKSLDVNFLEAMKMQPWLRLVTTFLVSIHMPEYTYILYIYSCKSSTGTTPGETLSGCRTQWCRIFSQALRANHQVWRRPPRSSTPPFDRKAPWRDHLGRDVWTAPTHQRQAEAHTA